MQRWPATMAQAPTGKEETGLPKNNSKWLEIAAPEFQQQHLDMSNYTVSVSHAQDSVFVVFTPLGQPEEVRGTIGKHPGYAVEICKKNMKVLRSDYTR